MVDNTLAFIDQGSLLWVQASGHVHGVQATWLYGRAVDLDGLGRVRDNLAHGLLGRRVECSPLPLGRHRWVAWPHRPVIDVAAPARSRAAVAEWADERANVPIDPQRGPCWHLGVLPLADDRAAVSLVASHTVIDGVGLCRAIADAVRGTTHNLGYPLPGARPRRRAVLEDAGVLIRGLPEAARAVVVGARLARRSAGGPGARRPPAPGDRDTPVAVPTATVYLDVADWDARAQALGGTSNSLFAGFAAKLAQRSGRVRADDGWVTLTYPVNDRADNDTRANALKSIDVVVDPAAVTTDLREVRRRIKEALALGLGNFAEQEGALPLIPLTPKAIVKRLPADTVGAAALPVGCSNLGDLDPATACVDGTAADYFSVRLVAQNLTRRSPELKYGELHLTSGRIGGKLFIAVRGYEPGTDNLSSDLRDLVAKTLTDFDLTGIID
ncbi:hypothetical protein [Mycobacterium talmoniae]|uniref:Diacylglycerol O-acyltransferase n=1 Tax=Mycobacterium talmoniae TaxID=1858794 RepID=A0A1S1NKV9_9MYCO|nr:hypothetical protein [Mycobacterium talmoniae]OHV04524.1 hypothetical protein BKN37_09505 [Mycobacterium talmoniae]